MVLFMAGILMLFLYITVEVSEAGRRVVPILYLPATSKPRPCLEKTISERASLPAFRNKQQAVSALKNWSSSEELKAKTHQRTPRQGL